MSLPIPSLDDRTYADLVREARARIPAVYPAWTDHNPADPGIVLLELLAWVAELLIYRANEITDENYRAYLKLLNGAEGYRELAARLDAGEIDLGGAVRATILGLRERYRAVTPADFEHLVRHDWPLSEEARRLGPAGAVRRVCCVPRRDLRSQDERAVRPGPTPQDEVPGHVSVVILPDAAAEAAAPAPAKELRAAVEAWLEPRRLLGVRHHVVGPGYVPVSIVAAITLRADYAPPELRNRRFDSEQIVAAAARGFEAALRRFLHPLVGGADGAGWPFGRDLYLSELYQLFDGQEGVDFVSEVSLAADEQEAWRVIFGGGGERAGVRLLPHELPAFRAVEIVVSIAQPTGWA